MSLHSNKPTEKVSTLSPGLKEEFSTETDPLATEVQPLLIDKVKSKCGEILVWKAANFILVCSTCKNEFNTMESFGIHWQKENNCLNHNFEDLKLTPKIEIEDNTEIICGPETFVEVKSEVIEEPKSEVQPVDAVNDSDRDNYDDDSLNQCTEPLATESVEIEFLETATLVADPREKDDSLQREDVKSTVKRKTKPRRTDKAETEIDLHCKICDLKFLKLISYQIHARSHKIPKDLKCKYCDKVLANSSEFSEHNKTHTGRKKYQCSNCLKTYPSRVVLDEHLRNHTGVRPYKCDSCPKTYTTKCYLEVHMRRHLNQADFVCEFCNKRYLEMENLVAHRRTHTGERPFQCEQCGMSFTTNGTLKKHRKRHAEKNFKCDNCGMAFFSKTELTEHSVKHTGARPYKCDICGNTFPRRGALRLHKDLHSTERKYVCDICGKSFKQHICLYKHRKLH